MFREFGSKEFLFIVLAARWTFLLALIAFVGGAAGGVFVAVLRTSSNRVLLLCATIFIYIVQGTPLLMQLYIWYFGINLLGLRVSAWTAVAIGMGINSSAFFGDVWRGAIQSVPRTQWDAAAALSLSYFQQLKFVIVPQALTLALPPTAGLAVQIIKSTSLAAIVGFTELTKAGQLVNSITLSPLRAFGLVALIYFIMCWPLSMLAKMLEARLDVRNSGQLGPQDAR
jgi:polar amino acid transport system permease protein